MSIWHNSSTKIKIVDFSTDISSLKGLVVVIDVLRAFSTACFVFQNGAKRIYAVADLEEARALKKQHPNWVLIGERKGLKLPDFDYGNSPAEIQLVNLSGKTVVMTTTSGTQAIEKLKSAQEIITGVFVNAAAVVNYIKKGHYPEINFLCTDSRWKDNEDFKLAAYLTDQLSGLPVNFTEIKEHLMNHPTAEGFLKHPLTETSIEDFHLCMDLDRFNFVIRAAYTSGEVYLEKIDPTI